MTSYRNVAEIDAAGLDPDQNCNMVMPYEVGRLMISALERAVEEGRVKGLAVQNEVFGGGIFVKQGRLRIQGRWGDARVLLLTLEWLAEQGD